MERDFRTVVPHCWLHHCVVFGTSIVCIQASDNRTHQASILRHSTPMHYTNENGPERVWCRCKSNAEPTHMHWIFIFFFFHFDLVFLLLLEGLLFLNALLSHFSSRSVFGHSFVHRWTVIRDHILSCAMQHARSAECR